MTPQGRQQPREGQPIGYGVVAFPRIDIDTELLKLRDRFDPDSWQPRPHIPLVVPITPANLDELLSITEFISQARRGIKPLACAFRGCVERGHLVVFACVEGKEALNKLRQSIMGHQPTTYLNEPAEVEAYLAIGRIKDPAKRAEVMLEANRFGRIVALVDSLTLIRLRGDETWQTVARFPFGIGRVDYYESLFS